MISGFSGLPASFGTISETQPEKTLIFRRWPRKSYTIIKIFKCYEVSTTQVRNTGFMQQA